MKSDPSPRGVPHDRRAPFANTGAVAVALLRGINVGGNKRVPMADLRGLATGLGFGDVATCIQSGNVVFRDGREPPALELALERALEQRFGFAVPVIVRSGAQWLGYAADNPFGAGAARRPAQLHLGVSKLPPQRGAARALAAYCKSGERVAIAGGAIWIDFAGGVARSKLSSAVLDREVGSTVTLRNWKTVQQLAAMVRSASGS
jgi:uncharacterized protein (DUF1697 family)